MTRGWRTLLSVTLAAVVMIAVGVSYIGGSYADSRAEEVLDQLLGNLPAGYHVTYESAESSIATDEVIVTGLVVRVDFAELIAAYGEEIETMAGDDGAAEDDAGAEEDASAEEDTGAADDAGAEDLDELEDLELTLTVERWAIADFDKENNPPRFMTQEVSGFDFDIGKLFSDEEMADIEVLLGGTSVRGDLRLRYHADEATGEVDIPYYDLVLENIGAFEFAAKFGGYHIWPKSDAPFAAVANMETLTLHHLSFSFADAEFFDRAVEITAKRSGLTVKEIKEQTALMIALMAAETPDKRLQVAAAALVAFVHEPGRLTLHLAPERPINLMVWSALAETNPTAALDEINFSVTKD
jgi:hypothetical protein